MCQKLLHSAIAALWLLPLYASAAQEGPDASIEEVGLYQQVANVPLQTAAGPTTLEAVYERTPVMVALIFTRCSGVCSPFLMQLSEDLRFVDHARRFRILVVSFDPRDDLDDMQRYAERFGLEDNDRWIFATTPRIDALTSSVAFESTWDSARRQYEHPALLVGVDESGYITRKMAGIRDPKALASLVRTINNEFIPAYPIPGSDALFSCFKYNPQTGKSEPSFGLLILLLPAVATTSLLFAFAALSRKWRGVA